MHIVLLLTDLFDSTGGIQTYNRCLVKSLNEILQIQNYKVTILVLNDKGNNSLRKNYITSPNITYKPFNGNKLGFVISSLLISKNADVIFFGHVNFSFLANLIPGLSKEKKAYLAVYGIDAWKKLSFLHKLGISKINKILSISRFTQQEMERFNDVPSNKFYILPPSLDPVYACNDQNLYTREDLNLPKGKIILTVSRLNPLESYKNIDMVINAMPMILKEVSDAFYIIVGEGEDCCRLKKLAKDIEVSDKVIFVGHVSDKFLSSYYNCCDVFVLPSGGEGFGIVFLEAMYHSKSCIGAYASAIPEVISDGKTGFLVKPNDIKNLADAIIKLLKDDNLRLLMGEAGKEKLEKEFSFEVFQNKLESLICH